VGAIVRGSQRNACAARSVRPAYLAMAIAAISFWMQQYHATIRSSVPRFVETN
jgi:hypothetical protein